MALLGSEWEEAVLMHEPHTQLSTAPTLTVCALHTGIVPFFTEADVPQVQDPCHELQDKLLHAGWNPNDVHGVLWAQRGQLMPPGLVFTLTTELDLWVHSTGLTAWTQGNQTFGCLILLCVCALHVCSCMCEGQRSTLGVLPRVPYALFFSKNR